MFCRNCGNKVDEKAYICVNCGVILENDGTNKVKNRKKNSNGTGVLSIIFGVAAFIVSLSYFFTDISEVGMYTEIYEKVGYAVGFTSIATMLTIISLVFSLIKRNKTCNKVGLSLTLISAFLIITEIMVVIIY